MTTTIRIRISLMTRKGHAEIVGHLSRSAQLYSWKRIDDPKSRESMSIRDLGFYSPYLIHGDSLFYRFIETDACQTLRKEIEGVTYDIHVFVTREKEGSDSKTGLFECEFLIALKGCGSNPATSLQDRKLDPVRELMDEFFESLL